MTFRVNLPALFGKIPCPFCDGAGIDPTVKEQGYYACPVCLGDGWVLPAQAPLLDAPAAPVQFDDLPF